MKKFVSLTLIVLAVLSCIFIAGCKDEETGEKEDTKVRVATLKGPTGMGMAKLISDSKKNNTKNKYEFTIAASPDQITSEIIKGNFDIAALPVNSASVLYNKTGGNIRIVGINTLGVLYMLENGNAINSVSDLKGKTIYSVGQGSTPEYVLKYVLQKNGIDPENDVKIEYTAENTELITMLSTGKAEIGFLPEPAVSSALTSDANLRIALDFNEEWHKISDVKLVQGVIIANKEFAEKSSDILNTFLEEYNSSVEFINSNTEEASVLVEEAEIIPKATIAKKAIPNCNICLITGEEMKECVNSMLGILYDFNKTSVGNTLPGNEVYYIQ